MGFGDGVYKSLNGGKTWTNMGLAKSEHIARILIDPRDSRVVYVAAEGPLWAAGGERGLYKSADGGKTWTLSLEISKDTAWPRSISTRPIPTSSMPRPTSAAARSPRSWAAGRNRGSTRARTPGNTWRKLTVGLPAGDKGKIGLAVSPLDPRVVYATVEAGPEERGFYRSADRGESFEKRNGYISGGTGPHYYQEIFADPSVFDRVYQMDPAMMVTQDGGRTWRPVGEKNKHGDNHAMAFLPGDPDYILNGSDGGLYETRDGAKTWRFFDNLPVTQFYKLALDNALPFYNVHGGAQDNGSQLGPSRTLNANGIRNADWIITYGADGYASAIDPADPDILYVEWQQGGLLRFDKKEPGDGRHQPHPGGRRAAPAIQLGRPHPDQSARPHPPLLRGPVRLAERRPGRFLDAHQPRPDPADLPPGAADHGQDLERRRALGPRGHVQVLDDHDRGRIAARRRPALRRHGRRPDPGQRGRREVLAADRQAPRRARVLLRQQDPRLQARQGHRLRRGGQP